MIAQVKGDTRRSSAIPFQSQRSARHRSDPSGRRQQVGTCDQPCHPAGRFGRWGLERRLTATAPNHRSALFGYAVLRANYNHDAPNYLDNFTGFVLDVLTQGQPEPLDENAVGQAVRDNFGLTIPDRVAGLLLRRAVKAGKASSDDGTFFTVDPSAVAGVQSLQANIATYENQQSEVLKKFLDFVSAHHPDRLSLVATDAEQHFHAFIDEHAVPLLRRAERGRRADTQWSDLQGPDYLIAAFILFLVEHDAQTFGYVVDAVKGAILTGVLDLGPGDLHRNLRDLTVVFDTPVLLKALGYLGEIQQRAVQQTLDLARFLNVRTVCFTHTAREIEGVLESVIPVLKSRGKTSGSLRAVDAHYLDRNAGPADILIDQNRIQTDLQYLGVRLIDQPDNRYAYGLDESALDDLLKKHLPTQRAVTTLRACPPCTASARAAAPTPSNAAATSSLPTTGASSARPG